MYIVCVCVYFVAFCFSVILAVSCSSSKQKKKRKKNIVALTQYSRARIFPHTHFSTSKNFKCRTKIFTFRRIKNSFFPCWRFAPSLPFITRSVVPAAGKKISVCLKHSDWPAIETHCRNRRERGRFRFLCFQRFSSFSPHGGGHRSSQVGTHVRRCPRLRLLRIR